MPTPRTTVCVLLYGDYPDLAGRCLVPIAKLLHDGLVDVRLGLNDVAPRSLDVIQAQLKCVPDPSAMYTEHHEGRLRIAYNYPQIYKYPMMRRLFYERPPATEFVMWFDDDSYIKADDPAAWLAGVETVAEQADMIGSIYSIKLLDTQKTWIRRQPWHAGVPLPTAGKFATGGWWVLRTDIIRQYNWPVDELRHRGGDVMLGQLLLQQGKKLVHYNKGVAINADEAGRESKSIRRGYDEPPIGT